MHLKIIGLEILLSFLEWMSSFQVRTVSFREGKGIPARMEYFCKKSDSPASGQEIDWNCSFFAEWLEGYLWHTAWSCSWTKQWQILRYMNKIQDSNIRAWDVFAFLSKPLLHSIRNVGLIGFPSSVVDAISKQVQAPISTKQAGIWSLASKIC